MLLISCSFVIFAAFSCLVRLPTTFMKVLVYTEDRESIKELIVFIFH